MMTDQRDSGQAVDGRYTVRRPLGTGGMATVFLAEDTALRREVALKVLAPALAADPVFVERFKREAQAAAALAHPHIVAVYNWGETDGTYYIVMEYVPGETVRERVRRDGPLREVDALDIAAQVADALAEAHAHGLIHRDVKPANILVRPDGRVQVTDFGIARAVGESRLTATNLVMGTAHYLAPEQVLHRPLDGRADLYALGCVLYEMLVGEPPFAAESLVAVAYKHVHELPPSVRNARPDLLPETLAVLTIALAKNPTARYADAAAMRDALLLACRAAETRDARAAAADEDTADVPLPPPGAAELHIPSAVPIVITATALLPEVAAPRPPSPVPGPPVPLSLPPVRRGWGPLLAVPLAILLLLLIGGATLLRRPGDPSRAVTAPPSGAAQVAAIIPTVPPAAPSPTARPTVTLGVVATGAASGTTEPTLPVPLPARATATLEQPILAPAASPLPLAPATVAPTLIPSVLLPPPTILAPAPTATPILLTPLPSTATPPPPMATPVLPPAPTPVPAPEPTATPRRVAAQAAQPQLAVLGFYDLVSKRQYDAAAALWSPGMQMRYPPAENIAGRFASTDRVIVQQAQVTEQTADRATVSVVLAEFRTGVAVPQTLAGSWRVVRTQEGWLLDDPQLQAR